jgi:hypothetical protein
MHRDCPSKKQSPRHCKVLRQHHLRPNPQLGLRKPPNPLTSSKQITFPTNNVYCRRLRCVPPVGLAIQPSNPYAVPSPHRHVHRSTKSPTPRHVCLAWSLRSDSKDSSSRLIMTRNVESGGFHRLIAHSITSKSPTLWASHFSCCVWRDSIVS